MQLKTYRALNMREALRAVKEELGADAIILSTREVRAGSGAFGLFGRTMVEVTAAVDRKAAEGRDGQAPRRTMEQEESFPTSEPRAGMSGRPTPGYRESQREDGTILTHARLLEGDGRIVPVGGRRAAGEASASSPLAGSFGEQMQAASCMQSIRDELSQIREEMSSLRALGRSGLATGVREEWKSLEEDVRGVRRLVGVLVKNERDLFAEQLEGSLRTAYYRLLESGLDPEWVVAIVKDLQARAPLDEQVADAVRSALYHRLAHSIKTTGPLLAEEDRSSAMPKAVMFVGPTGVGKTTTIAKLAAHYALQHKRRVALITLDTYRVAAVEQLRVYGNILGLAVDIALTCDDLTTVLHARRHSDLILIDTTGRSPLDQLAFGELKKLVGMGRHVESHLVLSAGTREADLAAILERFRPLPVTSLIFSKLDETTQYGGIINVLQRTAFPLSYLSTGQCVPEDLTEATPRVLTDLLLDGLPAVMVGRRDAAQATAPRRTAPERNVPLPEEKKSLLGSLGRALALRSMKKE